MTVAEVWPYTVQVLATSLIQQKVIAFLPYAYVIPGGNVVRIRLD